MKKALPLFSLITAICALLLCTTTALAQNEDVLTFFTQVSMLVENWGGYTWMLKVGGVITVIISAVKVSFIRPLWDKLGEAKFWLAPLLGLAAGLMSMGTELTWASAFAYMQAGAGAVILHELLDMVKKIPGIGSVWVSVIDIIKIMLKAPPSENTVGMTGSRRR